MGCVLKSTYLSYESNYRMLSETLESLENQIQRRKEENNIKEIDFDDKLEYLAYQEQLRSKQVLKSLLAYIPMPDYASPTEDTISSLTSEYFEIRFKQTELENTIARKLETIIHKLEIEFEKKKECVRARINTLDDFLYTKKIKNESIMPYLNKKFSDCISKNSLEELVHNLLKLSELQKDIELIQRRADYKNFLLGKEARAQGRIDTGKKITELQNQISELNANWADMKDKQREAAELLHFLQDTIEKNKVKLPELIQERIDLKKDLAGFDSNLQSLSKTQEIFKEKSNQLEAICRLIKSEEEGLGNIEIDEGCISYLKAESERINQEILEISSQIEITERSNQENFKETHRKNYLELEFKIGMVKDLTEEISEKEFKLASLLDQYTYKKKSQIVIKLSNNIKSLIRVALSMWKTFEILNKKPPKTVTLSLPIIKIQDTWEISKINKFFFDFISEINKANIFSTEVNTLNKPLHAQFADYIRSVYTETSDLEISHIAKHLSSKESTDTTLEIIKKMLEMDEDPFPYHFIHFLITAIRDFDGLKKLETEEASLPSILELVESYIGDNREVGSKIMYSIKPPNVSEEDYVLFHLKQCLEKVNMDFCSICDGAESFLDIARNDLKVWVDDDRLKSFRNRCEAEFDINFDLKVELSIKSLKLEKFSTGKIQFLAALIETYKEVRAKDVETLKSHVPDTPDITDEIFEKLINIIHPGLEPDFIVKLFNESLMDTTSLGYIKQSNFISIVMKHCIGGYGIGPFKTNELKDLAKKTLASSENFNKPKELNEFKISLTEEKKDKNLLEAPKMSFKAQKPPTSSLGPPSAARKKSSLLSHRKSFSPISPNESFDSKIKYSPKAPKSFLSK